MKLDKNKTTIFVFIGTNKHHTDAISPIVGTLTNNKYKNKKDDIIVIGTINKNIDAKNIKALQEDLIKLPFRDKFEIIAVDIGISKEKASIVKLERGIAPGSLIRDNYVVVGCKSIVVDVKGIYSKTNSPIETYEGIINNKYNKRIQKKINKRIYQCYNHICSLIEEKEKSKNEVL